MIIGEKRNCLTLVEITPERLDQKIVGIFNCDCGKKHKTSISRVKRGIIKSCGCITGKFRLGNNYNWKEGQVFGKFKLIQILHKNLNGNILGKFQCQKCEKYRIVAISYIAKNYNKMPCCQKKMIGKKFGKLEVIKYIKTNTYLCKCDCGNIRQMSGSYLTRFNWVIKSCKNCTQEQIFKKKGTSVGKLSGWYWSRIRKNAIQRGINIEITQEYAWKLFEKQNSKCALTNFDIELCNRIRENKQTASLDRIDNTKGYIEGNVQWVHKDINRMKWKFSQSRFIEISNAVSKNFLSNLSNL